MRGSAMGILEALHLAPGTLAVADLAANMVAGLVAGMEVEGGIGNCPNLAGRPSGPPQDVVTGFLTQDEEKSQGRPVGLAFDHTGALLIADDVGNAVWRVSTDPIGERPRAGT